MKTLLVVIISILLNSIPINSNECIEIYDQTICVNVINKGGPLQIPVNTSGLIIDCSNIRTVTSRFFSDVKDLNTLGLLNCSIFTIESNAFDGLDNLEGLAIKDNLISEVKEDTFNSLTNLKQLALRNNNIKEIKPKTFQQLTKLLHLNLEHNQLKNLNCEIFDNLRILEVINLGNNKLSALPENCFQNTKLRRLLINGNEITSIGAKNFLDYTPNLNKFDFYNNPWDCCNLMNTVDVLKQHSIRIRTREAKESTNKMIIIDGIGCNCYSKCESEIIVKFPGRFEESRIFEIKTRNDFEPEQLLCENIL